MNLSKKDFFYHLPETQIAKYPLVDRASSKLLVYEKGNIQHTVFSEIGAFLPENAHLVLNNAKVIPARLYFKRKTGAQIEVLLLEPIQPANYDEVFTTHQPTIWKAMVGNAKKWQTEETIFLEGKNFTISAKWKDRAAMLVEISHDTDWPFNQVLDAAGNLPLPPYLNRQTEGLDKVQYQTVMAKKEGSVAAPTAGLHFTPELFTRLSQNGIHQTELTLHVGAGTFLPLKDDNPLAHPMHREHFEISKSAIQSLLKNDFRVAVGTTSLRVLESLFWMGNDCHQNKFNRSIKKLQPYKDQTTLTYKQALHELLNELEKNNAEQLVGSTEIMILPHYQIRSIKALITNFHLPESTLLMLVASIIQNNWKTVYQEAINHDYRFLSFGDASLLFV